MTIFLAILALAGWWQAIRLRREYRKLVIDAFFEIKKQQRTIDYQQQTLRELSDEKARRDAFDRDAD